jgi:riboflavin kinase/FMN adenylyltransferase
MRIYENFTSNNYIDDDIPAVCIGGFDGVHLGHQELLKYTKESSNLFQIVTFDTLPKKYFNNEHMLLTTNNEKIELFKKFEPSNLVFINFEHVMKYSPKTFCEMLKNNMKAKKIYVGNDFKFGANREGDVDYLITYFGEDSVHTIPDYEHNNEKISSTLIKSFLSEGFVEQANEALGYEYSLTGTVIKGDQRGSQIGFPTANLKIDKSIQIPKNGVYKVDVLLNEYLYEGIMNIGYKPTVSEGTKQSLEVHIFDFNDDVYGTELTVHFKKFIRDEIKFSSIDELTQQISKDIEDINKN